VLATTQTRLLILCCSSSEYPHVYVIFDGGAFHWNKRSSGTPLMNSEDHFRLGRFDADTWRPWRWAIMGRPLLVSFLFLAAATGQNLNTEKPCIAFSSASSSPSNELAKAPLQAAVMQSGDFQFYETDHEGCWNVHVISLPVTNAQGKQLGYTISHTVTDPQDIEVGHALTFGPDEDIFVRAMRKAAADAIRNIRLAKTGMPSPEPVHHDHQHSHE
jgi:hypothetical protein